MGKLHEVLAVESDLKGKSAKIIQETLQTFKNRAGHFDSLHRVFKPDEEDGLTQPEETKPMVETVKDKLAYTANTVAEYLDVVFQKEATNTEAKADMVLFDGTVLATNMPATVLLSLENKLTDFRELYSAVPTLDPSEAWEFDEQEGTYKAENSKVRTKKTIRNHVLAPATDKHQAQVQIFNEDTRIGLVNEIKHSSKVTAAGKSAMLGRLDNLIYAAKKARQRANATEAVNVKIGKTLFDYIHKGADSN